MTCETRRTRHARRVYRLSVCQNWDESCFWSMWLCSSSKNFGIIKLVDKGWITTVKADVSSVSPSSEPFMLFKDWSEAVLSVQQFGAPFTSRVHATSRECVYFSHSFVSRRSISDYSDSASVAMVEKNERVNLEKENSNKTRSTGYVSPL